MRYKIIIIIIFGCRMVVYVEQPHNLVVSMDGVYKGSAASIPMGRTVPSYFLTRGAVAKELEASDNDHLSASWCSDEHPC